MKENKTGQKKRSVKNNHNHFCKQKTGRAERAWRNHDRVWCEKEHKRTILLGNKQPRKRTKASVNQNSHNTFLINIGQFPKSIHQTRLTFVRCNENGCFWKKPETRDCGQSKRDSHFLKDNGRPGGPHPKQYTRGEPNHIKKYANRESEKKRRGGMQTGENWNSL